ncbi:MAG TPA: hypothetical protein VGJ60_34580 [Chloroflexota bacterium]
MTTVSGQTPFKEPAATAPDVPVPATGLGEATTDGTGDVAGEAAGEATGDAAGEAAGEAPGDGEAAVAGEPAGDAAAAGEAAGAVVGLAAGGLVGVGAPGAQAANPITPANVTESSGRRELNHRRAGCMWCGTPFEK